LHVDTCPPRDAIHLSPCTHAPFPSCSAPPCAGPLTVEPLLHGGASNPTFEVTDKAAVDQLCEVLKAPPAPVPTCRSLGFTGWSVNGVTLRGSKQADDVLLREAASLDAPVLAHIKEEATRLQAGGDAHCKELEQQQAKSGCPGAVVGPDDPHQVKYDPQNDDDGCFVSRQGDNNCYNYGNDIASNTFAQPGRGSGQCAKTARPWAVGGSMTAI